MIQLYNEILYRPLANALVFLTALVPGHDVGLAIMLLTLLVRIIIFPLTHRSLVTQLKLKELEPEISKIKAQHPSTEEQGRKMMELYQAHGVNPLSGCFLLIIQLPILIALYQVFWHGIFENSVPLYSFIQAPEALQTKFLGLIELSSKSWILAALAGLSQFLQIKLSNPLIPKTSANFKEELSRAISIQSLYIFPILIFFISFRFPAALPLYWTASNVFATLHEAVVRQRARLRYGTGGTKDKRID